MDKFEDYSNSPRALELGKIARLTQRQARQEEGDLARAVSDFEMAVKLGPGLSEGWCHLASAYDRLGRKAEATRAREGFHQIKQNEDEGEKEMMLIALSPVVPHRTRTVLSDRCC